jgi:hypothetical protein
MRGKTRSVIADAALVALGLAITAAVIWKLYFLH